MFIIPQPRTYFTTIADPTIFYQKTYHTSTNQKAIGKCSWIEAKLSNFDGVQIFFLTFSF